MNAVGFRHTCWGSPRCHGSAETATVAETVCRQASGACMNVSSNTVLRRHALDKRCFLPRVTGTT